MKFSRILYERNSSINPSAGQVLCIRTQITFGGTYSAAASTKLKLEIRGSTYWQKFSIRFFVCFLSIFLRINCTVKKHIFHIFFGSGAKFCAQIMKLGTGSKLGANFRIRIQIQCIWINNTGTVLTPHPPEFVPEPGVLAVQVGVHADVLLEVLLHVGPGRQLTTYYDDHSLNMKTM